MTKPVPKQMFVVRYRGKNARNQFAECLDMNDWKPAESDEFECNTAEALERFRRLVQAGRDPYPQSVDRVVPWCVEIVDATTRKVMTSVTCEKSDVPVGPWARSALALSGQVDVQQIRRP